MGLEREKKKKRERMGSVKFQPFFLSLIPLVWRFNGLTTAPKPDLLLSYVMLLVYNRTSMMDHFGGWGEHSRKVKCERGNGNGTRDKNGERFYSPCEIKISLTTIYL